MTITIIRIVAIVAVVGGAAALGWMLVGEIQRRIDRRRSMLDLGDIASAEKMPPFDPAPDGQSQALWQHQCGRVIARYRKPTHYGCATCGEAGEWLPYVDEDQS